MKEKIFKLLNSQDDELIVLGIKLAFEKLPREECLKIGRNLLTGKDSLYYIHTSNINISPRMYECNNFIMFIGLLYMVCYSIEEAKDIKTLNDDYSKRIYL